MEGLLVSLVMAVVWRVWRRRRVLTTDERAPDGTAGWARPAGGYRPGAGGV